jgi:uncharacterized membrane protein
MIATYAPSPWPAPAAAMPWRFGQAWVDADRGVGVQWTLRRNCSISPRQLLGVYLSLCCLSLLIAAGFALSGAPVVLAFSGLELVLIGLAFLVYARHARDGDTLTLSGQSLAVEQSLGGRATVTEFRTEWLCIEPSAGQGSLVELAGQGRRVHIGRFLRPELRAALAQELRLALRHVGSYCSPADNPASALPSALPSDPSFDASFDPSFERTA